MASISYNIAQVQSATSGAETTLVTIPADHEYIGTIRACFANTAASGTTEYSINVTTAGSGTTAGYIAKDIDASHQDPPDDYSIALPAGYKVYVKSTTGEMSFSFHYQDKDNS